MLLSKPNRIITVHKNPNDTKYFVSHAILASKLSKDPKTKVGACIVSADNTKLLAFGFNNMPNDDFDGLGMWKDSENNFPVSLENKNLYICHAEQNAILNALQANQTLKDCILYTTLFPCNECAKIMVRFKIAQVVYLSDKHNEKVSTRASKYMFDCAGIRYYHYTNSGETINIKF